MKNITVLLLTAAFILSSRVVFADSSRSATYYPPVDAHFNHLTANNIGINKPVSGYRLDINGVTNSNSTIQTIGSEPGNWSGVFENTGGPYGLYASNLYNYAPGNFYHNRYAMLAYNDNGLLTNGTVQASVATGGWAGIFESRSNSDSNSGLREARGLYVSVNRLSNTKDIVYSALGAQGGYYVWGLLTNGRVEVRTKSGPAGNFVNEDGSPSLVASNTHACNGDAYYCYAALAYSAYGLKTNGIVQTIASQPSYWAGVFENTSGPYGVYASNNQNIYATLANAGYGLYTNGKIRAAAYLNLSDQRLKQDILPITGALDKVQRLNGITFTWKQSGVKDIGVTAQNVEKVLPEIVKTGPDGMKSVEYGNMVGLLIEAIKEQQKEIEELEKKAGGNK